MDFSIGLDQDTESKDTGISTPALTPSVEGADLMVGEPMISPSNGQRMEWYHLPGGMTPPRQVAQVCGSHSWNLQR